MRFKRHLAYEFGLKQIDIVPLIDVVLMLLLFFILLSNFALQPGIKVTMPHFLTSEDVKYQQMEIMISRDNKVYVNGTSITPKELRQLLEQKRDKNTSIVIKADKHTPLARVIDIWDVCRQVGISQIHLATPEE